MKSLCSYVFALVALLVALPSQAHIPVYGYKIVHSYPHDPKAFTEGLFYKNGYLYESTGGLGTSTLRKVALGTGTVVQQTALPATVFGEGSSVWKDHLLMLTWHGGQGFMFGLKDLKLLEHGFRYPGEGWGLTRDNQHLYMSDGTSTLRVLNPDTLRPVRYIHVTAHGKPVPNINELEWVNGEIYANIWQTDRIARIDPNSGQVRGWIDLTGLFDYHALADPGNDVLNGIAYDAQQDRLFVTGKCWPKVFEIRLTMPWHHLPMRHKNTEYLEKLPS